ncbi:MAG: DUF302 domain-containing protein [Acidimicrobiales bacterium]
MDGIEITVELPIERAEVVVREALAAQGFGILTEIDVAATFKAKLGVERPPLKILGACNPHFAYRALELDPSVALMLPCNVVLAGDGECTHVSIADPRTLMPGAALALLAEEAAGRLSEAAGVIGRAG